MTQARQVLEIGPNLSQALQMLAVAAMFGVMFWAMARHKE